MDWLLLILTTVVGILGIRYFFFRNLNKLKQLGVLHIKPWPLLGNLVPAVSRRSSFTNTVDRIYKLYEDADYAGFYNFLEPVILIRSPELTKSIAIKNFDHFVDHRAFVDPDIDPFMAKNVFSLRGERWKEVRNLLSPAFTSSKMKAMFNLMSNCGKNFTDHLAEKTCELDTKEIFARYTTDVIATCAYGIDIDTMKDPENDFYVLGRNAMKFGFWRIITFLLITNFPKFSKLLNLTFSDPSTVKFFTSVVKETIDTRDRNGIVRPDMIQLMMEARGNKPDEGSGLTIMDMTAQAFIFFFAGFDTTSTTLCFAAYEIAVNPDVQKKLQEEVDAVMEKTNGELTYKAINEMEYLDAVINEVLRMHPVAPFMDRVCVKRFELPPALPGGKPVTIEPGQNVWFAAYSLQRDPKYFPDPNKFDPERFIGNRRKEIDPFTYFPFGLGPRMCIGNRFALLEMKVLFFHLLSKCDLKPSAKTLVPLQLSKTNFAVTAEGGFWLQLGPRDTSAGKAVQH